MPLTCNRPGFQSLKHGGSCDNSRAYHVDRIERAVVEGLKTQIGSKDAIAYYVRVFNEEQRLQSAEANANRSKRKLKLGEAQRRLDRLVDAIAAGVITTEEAGQRMPALRSAVETAKAALAAAGEPLKVVTLHPKVVDRYLQNLEALDRIVTPPPRIMIPELQPPATFRQRLRLTLLQHLI